jgi:hypothetical protein
VVLDDAESQLAPVEVPAGSLVFFGSLRVHPSLPNPSEQDRHVLLDSYHPARRRKSIEGFMQLAGRK